MATDWSQVKTVADLERLVPAEILNEYAQTVLDGFDARIDQLQEMLEDATKESALKAETDADAKDAAYARVRTSYGFWEAAGKGVSMPDGLAAAVSEYAQFFEDSPSVETAMVAELTQAHEGV